MKPLIIFDLDGTLADTSADLIATLNAVLLKYDRKPVDPGAVRHLIGRGGAALLEAGFGQAYAAMSAQEKAHLLGQFVDHYERHLMNETKLYPGIVQALDELRERGFMMAVCTSKNTKPAEEILLGLGIRHHFLSVCGGDYFPGFKKPDRRHVQGTMSQAGHRLEWGGIFIGDATVDVKSAQNTGLPVVFVTYGYNDVAAVDSGADMIVHSADKLPDAIAVLSCPLALN